MLILALDTSSPQISVAVLKDDKVLSEIQQQGNASTLLLPCLEKALNEAKTTLEQIEAFAIGEGPGSYNGLRCGFATLTGLLLPQPRPAVKVSSLAAAVWSSTTTSPKQGFILNARRNNLFFSKFVMENHLLKLQEEGMVNHLEEIPGLKSSDTSWWSYEMEGFPALYPSAVGVAHLGINRLNTVGPEKTLLEPRYLRPPV